MSIYNIAHWARRRAELHGGKAALVEGARSLTYAALAARVHRLCHVLAGRGLSPGDRFAILAANCLEYAEAIFAAANLGLILVPLNVRLAPAEWRFQVEDSGARLCLVGPEYRAQADLAVPCLYLEGDYEEALARAPATPLPYACDAAAPLLILYTSGTTGRPKGAVLTQANLFWNAVNIAGCIDLTSRDVTLSALPFFHSGGLGLYFLPTLHQGGTVVILSKFEPATALATLLEQRVSHFFGVPAHWLLIAQDPAFERADLSGLRTLCCGGAPLPVPLIQTYWEKKGRALRQGMGLTETSPTLFLIDEEHAVSRAGSVGKPALHTEAAVWDDGGRPLGPGEVGELVVRGPNVFQGYWNLPEATAEAFKGGWFHTGDLAYYDAEGFFYIVDRKKDMLISGGENVYPAEVENVLYALPQVAEVAVIGRRDARWGEVPVAVAALRPGQSLTLAEVQAFCQGKLGRYKIPRDLVLVDALPRNAAGKVLKTELKSRYGSVVSGEG